MKIILALLMLTQNAFAVHEAPPDTRTQLEKQFIEYSRRFFLDAATFDARQVERIELERWTTGNRFGHGTNYQMKKSHTREGLIIELSASGQAADVETLFDGLFTNIISVLNTKGGWLWSLPSSDYKSYWDTVVGQTRNDIHREALKEWVRLAKPSDAEFREVCVLLLK